MAPATEPRRNRWSADAGRSGAGASAQPPSARGHDQRPGAPDDRLLRALRDTFAERAGRPPAGAFRLAGEEGVAELVAAARAGARRTRRRRAAGAGTTAVLVAAAGLVSMVRPPLPYDRPSPPVAEPAVPVAALTARPAPARPEVQHGGAGAAEPMLQRQTLPVDVVASGRLLTTSGHSVDVSRVGAVHQASRAGSGWLVVASEADSTGRSLWRIQPNGRQEPLVVGADALVLAADGRWAAWRDGAELVLARIDGARLVEPVRTPIPADATPVGLIGDGALLARTGPDGQIDGYDVWWPGRGAFAPAWVPGLAAVYGSMPDGRTLVAAREGPARRMRVPQDADLDSGFVVTARTGVCLVMLDTADLFRQRISICGLGLATGLAGRVSPDGRWLLAQSAAGSAVLVDLVAAAAGRASTVAVGPGPVGEPVWLDASSVVYGPVDGTLVRVRVPAEGAGAAIADTLALPELPAAPQALIAP